MLDAGNSWALANTGRYAKNNLKDKWKTLIYPQQQQLTQLAKQSYDSKFCHHVEGSSCSALATDMLVLVEFSCVWPGVSLTYMCCPGPFFHLSSGILQLGSSESSSLECNHTPAFFGSPSHSLWLERAAEGDVQDDDHQK